MCTAGAGTPKEEREEQKEMEGWRELTGAEKVLEKHSLPKDSSLLVPAPPLT